MNDTNRELWVGESRFYFGEDNILYETIVGDTDEDFAGKAKEATYELKKKFVVDKLDLLIDLNKCGKPSPRARKMGKELFESEDFGKIALYGLHPVARVIASFIIGVSKKRDIRFFKTEGEALAWLKE